MREHESRGQVQEPTLGGRPRHGPHSLLRFDEKFKVFSDESQWHVRLWTGHRQLSEKPLQPLFQEVQAESCQE